MELTTFELQALKSITQSDFYEQGRKSIVWDYSVYDQCTIPTRSRAGVYSSLVQKGIIRISEGEKKYIKHSDGTKSINKYWSRDGQNFGTVSITPEGYTFLDSLNLINEYGDFLSRNC